MITLTDREHIDNFVNALKARLEQEHTTWGAINEKWHRDEENRFMVKVYSFWKIWKSGGSAGFPWLAVASLCMQGWLKENIRSKGQS